MLQLTLPDGRRLAWIEYGAPDGLPMFYAHGMPGSRLEGRLFAREAQRAGIRLICFDRPGIGGSDFDPHYRLLDFPRDLDCLADHLGLAEFGVLGWSSGGPMALSCGVVLPKRVRCLILLASYTHFIEFDAARQLLRTQRQWLPLLVVDYPALVGCCLWLLRLALRWTPSLYLTVARSSGADRDLTLLSTPEIQRLFMQNQKEAFRQGVEGVLRDLYLECRDWGFRLADVATPVLIYQGCADRFVPWRFAAHLAQSLPRSRLRYLKGEGHLFPLDTQWQCSLWAEVRQLWRQSGRCPAAVSGARTPA